MRVLLVVPMMPQAGAHGAIPKLLYAEQLGLRERCELTLVTTLGGEPGEEEAAAELVRSGVAIHFADRRRSDSALQRMRVRVRMASRWLRGNWPWRTVWFAAPEVQSLLDKLASEQEFDVCAIEDSAMSVYRFPAGVPTVFTEHEAIRAPASGIGRGRLKTVPRRLLGEIDWRRWGRFARNAWSRFDLIQTFSESDARAISDLCPEVSSRLRVNPFGIVMPPLAEPGREEPRTLLFVGNFTHPPNRDAAIWLAREIMPRIHEAVPDAHLRIVGASPPPEVASLAGDGIEVIPDAPNIDPHLEAAAVVLAPIRTGGGMRMKVLEALARGKALVTTPLGVEGFSGFDREPPLVVAADAKEMAQAIAVLLADPDRRRRLGIDAREFVERNYSPGAWAKRLEAVYREACEGSSQRAPKTEINLHGPGADNGLR